MATDEENLNQITGALVIELLELTGIIGEIGTYDTGDYFVSLDGHFIDADEDDEYEEEYRAPTLIEALQGAIAAAQDYKEKYTPTDK